MDGIAKAKDFALSIFLDDDVVNNPFADVENFKFHRLVSNDLFNSLVHSSSVGGGVGL